MIFQSLGEKLVCIGRQGGDCEVEYKCFAVVLLCVFFGVRFENKCGIVTLFKSAVD